MIMQIGPDWTQASENERVEALVAQGVNAPFHLSLATLPAQTGFTKRSARAWGVNVINFGTDTEETDHRILCSGNRCQAGGNGRYGSADRDDGAARGKILNVLEGTGRPQYGAQKGRRVEEVVANYPDVEIVQGDRRHPRTREEAVTQIESALTANLGEIDGIICTGTGDQRWYDPGFGRLFMSSREQTNISMPSELIPRRRYEGN